MFAQRNLQVVGKILKQRQNYSDRRPAVSIWVPCPTKEDLNFLRTRIISRKMMKQEKENHEPLLRIGGAGRESEHGVTRKFRVIRTRNKQNEVKKMKTHGVYKY